MSQHTDIGRLDHQNLYPGHPGSRDFWQANITCNATQCINNSGFNYCAVPSQCELDSTGKCKGFKKNESL